MKKSKFTRGARARLSGLAAAVLLTLLPLAAARAEARGQSAAAKGPRFCSATAQLQKQACLFEKRDGALVARAICANLDDPAARDACLADAASNLRDELQLCRAQRDAREDLCARVGQARYEPDFDPASYDDPRAPSHPNPYQPLHVGDHWSFAGGPGETGEIEVRDAVKSIEGVSCLVLIDTAYADGVPVEVTDDWVAARSNGDVVYCGENTAEYETFAGDVPQEPERVSTDGSFKAGRDGAKAGLLFPAAPRVGDTYRQEWAPGDAEDAATVLSTTYAYGHDATLDQLVPPALAQLLCSAGDCIVTAEFTPLSPGDLEHKYYARGIGFFLATTPGSGAVEQLVGCNMDARCASLPQP